MALGSSSLRLTVSRYQPIQTETAGCGATLHALSKSLAPMSQKEQGQRHYELIKGLSLTSGAARLAENNPAPDSPAVVASTPSVEE